MPPPLTVTFTAGATGAWHIERISAACGEPLAPAARLAIAELPAERIAGVWSLSGVVSHPRYATSAELRQLAAVQAGLSRPESTRAALIPIRKSDAWWAKGQDDRRAIFEDGSRHIARSMKYLPAVARRLHHSRDLGEPFDFLTWFEYAPDYATAFEDLVGELRATEEWRYVVREVDVRLTRAEG
jgi:chlorite dismutase